MLIYDQSDSRKTVLDRSPGARDTVVGMSLDQALARCPDAGIIEADPSAYREAWGHILDALEQISPVVEDAGLGLAYLDLRGLGHLYGSEEGLLTTILEAVPEAYRARVSVAEGKFPAYAVALSAKAGGARHAPEGMAAFVRPLPVTLLPTSWKTKERLMSFGLNTLGDVAHLPFNAMQGEFGKEGAFLWHLANGEDETRLLPRLHQEAITHELGFAAPTASLSAILVAVESLLIKAFNDPRLRGRFARLAFLRGQVLDGAPWSKRIVFRDLVGDKDRALFILSSNLERITLPGPLENLSITFVEITGEAGRQESLFFDVRRRAHLDNAVRQLRAKLGRNPFIYQIREVEPWSRIPERRRVLVPYEP